MVSSPIVLKLGLEEGVKGSVWSVVSSDWRPRTNGMMQGSVQGPLLSILYTKDLDDNVVTIVSNFADDIQNKWHAALESVAEQKHLGRLVHGFWEVASQMKSMVKKEFCMLSLIGMGIELKCWDSMLQLSKS